MKRAWVVVAMVVSTMFILSSAWANPWAVVANSPNGSIFTVDLGQTPPQVYGPFLDGQLGSHGGGMFDVAITPDQQYALVSNFGDSLVSRVNISDPTAPVFAGSINIGFFAEDIAIAPNGAWAAVTDGGFSSRVAFIDLATFTLSGVYNLGDGYYANCVAIASDSRTMVFGDYFTGAIIWGVVNAARDGLESVQSISCLDPNDPDNSCRPVNVGFAPNDTAIFLSAVNSRVDIVYMPTPGTIIAGNPFFLTPLPGGNTGTQSIDFSSDGSTAYILRNGSPPAGSDPLALAGKYDNSSGIGPLSPDPDRLITLKINGPGSVSPGSVVADLLSETGSQLFGVDVLALAGGRAVAGNPTLSGGITNLSLVNLSTHQVTAIPLGEGEEDPNIPTGVATFSANTIPSLNSWGMAAFIVLTALAALFILLRRRSRLENA